MSGLPLQQAAEIYNNTDHLVTWQYLVPQDTLIPGTDCEIIFGWFLTFMYLIKGYAE